MSSDALLFDDQWRVRFYHIEDVSYESIDIRRMTRPYWVFSYIREGRVEVTEGDCTQSAAAGQVMVHAPGLPFSEKAVGPGRHLWFLIEAANPYGIDLFSQYPVSEILTLTRPDLFVELFEKLLHAWKKEDGLFKELELSGLGLLIVQMLLEDWDRAGRPPRRNGSVKPDERLNQIVTYLNTSFDRKITRQTLAQLVHLNPNYLDRIFQERFHIKPMQYLRELRLKHAKRLLESSDGTLSEIAVQCGLNDAPYLSHQFQIRYGHRPGQYREQVRQARKSFYGNQDHSPKE